MAPIVVNGIEISSEEEHGLKCIETKRTEEGTTALTLKFTTPIIPLEKAIFVSLFQGHGVMLEIIAFCSPLEVFRRTISLTSQIIGYNFGKVKYAFEDVSIVLYIPKLEDASLLGRHPMVGASVIAYTEGLKSLADAVMPIVESMLPRLMMTAGELKGLLESLERAQKRNVSLESVANVFFFHLGIAANTVAGAIDALEGHSGGGDN